MTTRARTLKVVLASAAAAALGAAVAAQPARGADPEPRYALANGCYVLHSQAAGAVVRKVGGGYVADATAAADGEPFRMKATDLGSYLLYGRAEDFLALAGASGVAPANQASAEANWRVSGDGPFTIRSQADDAVLAVDSGGRLVTVADPGAAALFSFLPATGCAEYPEIELNVTGEPFRGATPHGEVRGLVDAHMHMMAFEFLGGRAHCGRPWHPYGVAHALVDCPDHHPNGEAAILENFVSHGSPAGTHDPVGWPTFRHWPDDQSLTHETSYYRWVERAYRGGLRIFVNLLVENAALCKIYPYKQNSCNEMDAVRLQAERIRELERYIDAQHGGPGRGWFRIVESPFEARRVINDGKLAVVLGIEISTLFDCGLDNGQPLCDEDKIDRNLEAVWDLGVRDLEINNKFDNAFSGVAGDAFATGVLTNSGNRLETGRFWQLETCEGDAHDKPQYTLPGTDRDELVGAVLQAFLPPGATPVYPAAPHCNQLGLSRLGEYLVRALIRRGMMIDPDHMSVLGRNQLLNILEAEDYSGIISSHSWSTDDAYERIYRLGGFITPYAGSSTGFVKEWRKTKALRDNRFYWGFGYGADMNGFGSQGPPRPDSADNPVRYPFRSFDGGTVIDKQRSGERVYDINADGVDHYGLYPDWIEDLRMIAGDEIVDDMSRGAEAYLQMWERARGIPAGTRSKRGRFTSRGFGRVRLGDSAGRLLRRAGQPGRRTGRAWRFDVEDGGRAKVVAVLDRRRRVALVSSNAERHSALGIDRGDSARRARRRGARSIGRGILVRRTRGGRAFVYGTRRGRVRYVAVASRGTASNPAALRAALRSAGLR